MFISRHTLKWTKTCRSSGDFPHAHTAHFLLNRHTMLRDIGRADLIILDEFGYVPFDIDGARLLYQIIAGSYERRSIIFTTNIEFSKWGTVFADDKLAAAIIDRIVHHGRLLEFTGQSRRVSEALMFGRNTSAQPEK